MERTSGVTGVAGRSSEPGGSMQAGSASARASVSAATAARLERDREERCSIARSLQVVGERWSLLIVREALRGASTFSDFRTRLGVPSDVLTARLARLVDAGVFEKVAYREPGERERHRYSLTPSGLALKIVLASLVQWGDDNRPSDHGRASVVTDARTGSEVRVGFIDVDGTEADVDDVRIVPGPAARTTWQSL